MRSPELEELYYRGSALERLGNTVVQEFSSQNNWDFHVPRLIISLSDGHFFASLVHNSHLSSASWLEFSWGCRWNSATVSNLSIFFSIWFWEFFIFFSGTRLPHVEAVSSVFSQERCLLDWCIQHRHVTFVKFLMILPISVSYELHKTHDTFICLVAWKSFIMIV